MKFIFLHLIGQFKHIYFRMKNLFFLIFIIKSTLNIQKISLILQNKKKPNFLK